MVDRFDVQQYVQRTRVNGPEGIVLVARLVKAAPKHLPERIRDALSAMREDGVHLQEVLMERLKRGPESMRPLDLRLDGGWMALSEALAACARLEGTPEAKEAKELSAQVFPQGTSFVKATYAGEWTTSANTLEIIDENGLATRIDKLVGKQYLAFIRPAHQAFGDALGVGDAPLKEAEDTTALSDALDALTAAIAEYGRLMVGWLDWNDPDNVKAFRAAMAPLDAHRRSRSSSSASDAAAGDAGQQGPQDAAPTAADGGNVSPTDPIPPVTTEATG